MSNGTAEHEELASERVEALARWAFDESRADPVLPTWDEWAPEATGYANLIRRVVAPLSRELEEARGERDRMLAADKEMVRAFGARVEVLEAALRNVSVHSAHNPRAHRPLLVDLLARCGDIARRALSTPTPKGLHPNTLAVTEWLAEAAPPEGAEDIVTQGLREAALADELDRESEES